MWSGLVTMARAVRAAIYPSVPARYPTGWTRVEAVTRLRARVKRTIFQSLFSEAAIGPVSAETVRLYRNTPFFANSFRPVFVGRFRETPDGVVLEGCYSTFLFSKIFMTAWCLLPAVFAIVAFTTRLVTSCLRYGGTPACAESWKEIVGSTGFPLGMLVVMIAPIMLGILFSRFFWWLSRGDIPFLADTIKAALGPRR